VVGGFYKMDEAKRAEILDLAWGEWCGSFF
jgi:hypothetical protein